MFTIQAKRAHVTHNYQGQCYAHDSKKHILIIDELESETNPGRQFTLPLTGEKAYDLVTIKNASGVVVEQHHAFVPPVVEKVAAKTRSRKTAAAKKPRARIKK